MSLPRLIVITDWSLGAQGLLENLGELVSLGPRVAVQHRHPGASARQFLEEAQRLSELCRRHGTPLFINGRLDVARLVEAHLHLPAHSYHLADARAHLPPSTWISVSVHDLEELERRRGADLVLLSPVFGAHSKPDDPRPPLGPDGFHRLAEKATAPVFALGAVSDQNIDQLRTYGAASVSTLLRTPRPREHALKMLARLECAT